MRDLIDDDSYTTLHPRELRERYVVGSLFQSGALMLARTDLDRAIIGGAQPGATPIALTPPPGMASAFFCERRELGVFNTGGLGTVEVEGTRHPLDRLDCLYIGLGTRDVHFSSADPSRPASFYLLSYPAVRPFPVSLVTSTEARVLELGGKEGANERRIRQYVHEEGARSCRLVMGYTEILQGSVWNTMPCHRHPRRTEIYFYFDLPAGERVLHVMGRPEATRTVWVGDREAVLSPDWSVHFGVGTSSYAFIWGMGGENQGFHDMDHVETSVLR